MRKIIKGMLYEKDGIVFAVQRTVTIWKEEDGTYASSFLPGKTLLSREEWKEVFDDIVDTYSLDPEEASLGPTGITIHTEKDGWHVVEQWSAVPLNKIPRDYLSEELERYTENIRLYGDKYEPHQIIFPISNAVNNI